MKYIDLKQNLKEPLKSTYLIFGEDRYLCFDALKKIQDAAAISIADMNSVTILGESATAKDIVASASIYPFGDAFRLVIVKNFQPPKAKAEREELEKYLSSPLASTILVFFNPEGADGFKGLPGITEVDCSKIDAKFISAFVKNALARENIRSSEEAVNKLIMFTGGDMTRVSNELEKLIAYAQAEGELTTKMVEDFVVQDVEYEIYQLSEFLAKGDSGSAFALIDNFMTKPNSAFSLISPLYANYRRALFASINKDKSPSELANLLGVKEYAIRMLGKQTSVFPPKKLKLIVDMIAEYDKKIKIGEMKEAVAIKMIASNILNIRG